VDIMNKLYIGIVTFGNLQYTKVCMESIRRTATVPIHFVVVVGKPGDEETVAWLDEFGYGADLDYIVHQKNMGFPTSINDIYDAVYEIDPWADILFVGNDTMAYPGAVDELAELAVTGEYDYVTAKEVRSVAYLARYPQYRDMFGDGGELLDGDKFTDKFLASVDNSDVMTSRQIEWINGFHNFAIVRRSFFDKVGYVDTGFYPAYFEDNDYVTRGFIANCKFSEVVSAKYLHFHSRTVVEAQPLSVNARYYPLNRRYYIQKWGGVPGQNLYTVPFAGKSAKVGELTFPPEYFTIEDVEGDRMLLDLLMIEHMKWTPLQFAGRHAGQRCIIACNGPSLNDVDMSLLEDEIVIGLNRGYLKEDLPLTYLVAVNGQVLNDYGSEIVSVPTMGTFTLPIEPLWRPHVFGLRFQPEIGFYPNVEAPIYQGHTVTFCALQLAYYMGFKEVILIGCDHNFPRAEGHETNKSIISVGDDTDHFDPLYFPAGSTWETPNLARSEEAYALAKAAFEAGDRTIIDATAGGHLQVFDKRSLVEALA